MKRKELQKKQAPIPIGRNKKLVWLKGTFTEKERLIWESEFDQFMQDLVVDSITLNNINLPITHSRVRETMQRVYMRYTGVHLDLD